MLEQQNQRKSFDGLMAAEQRFLPLKETLAKDTQRLPIHFLSRGANREQEVWHTGRGLFRLLPFLLILAAIAPLIQCWDNSGVLPLVQHEENSAVLLLISLWQK